MATATATPTTAASAQAAQHAFEQSKLTRREWEGLEAPLPPDEIAILKMITAGWHDPDVCTNPRRSVLSVTKLGSLSAPHDFVYERFLAKEVGKLAEQIPGVSAPVIKAKPGSRRKLTSADTIRLANIDFDALTKQHNIWDFALLKLVRTMVTAPSAVGYYTLARALEARVDGTNKHLLAFVADAHRALQRHVTIHDLILNIEDASELNTELETFANRRLYKHQRDLVAALKRSGPKVVFYQAPTGTGKTLSPLAVSEGYKVIFVCASKHVGMQLARACISIHKRIAVAFGCRDAGDIKLHFFAVSECIRKRRSGQIGKIDHSQGQKADLVIADATSYTAAMHYMLAFNKPEQLLVYWDEPTIAMDKKQDELHDIVRRSWRDNVIPNIVLSSATLPDKSKFPGFLDTVQAKFSIPDESVIAISNYECARTVPLVLKSGYVAMPHNVARDAEGLAEICQQCRSRATLLRHVDLGVAARYLLAAHRLLASCGDATSLDRFETLDTVTPEAVKRAYLDCLLPLSKAIGFKGMQEVSREPQRFSGGVKLGTSDAASITHGPVLYLATDTEKVAKYLIRDANPAAAIIEQLEQQAETNTKVLEQIQRLEKDIADRRGADARDGDDSDDEAEHGGGALAHKLSAIRGNLTEIRLPGREVPNTEDHQRRYHSAVRADAFTGSVPPHHLEEVLRLDVDSWKKMLLMMGIGVFGEECPTYCELMSRMASARELFCVIAGTDYVYGTNYQFCHGYIGKDLSDMPVEKLYQALGRVGRGRQAGQYSWRLRDDVLAERVFSPDRRLTEARRMDRLMSSR
jgi:hypothetical protein